MIWGAQMFDSEFDHQARAGKKGTVLRGRSLWLLGMVCIAWLLPDLLGVQVYSRRPYTCAVCRADREESSFLGWKWSSLEETDCSLWYGKHVEPAHAHAWIPCTYCRRFGIPGIWGGYGCVVGGPLTGLSRRVQIMIYQHFKDPLEGKNLFIQLGRMGPEAPRRWEALMDWVEHDYPGTWQGWWKQQRGDSG